MPKKILSTFTSRFTTIQKRDGRIAPFDWRRIATAIGKAFKAVGAPNDAAAERVAENVVRRLEQQTPKDKLPNVEGVQDRVEQELIAAGFVEAAKAYILYRKERELVREQKREILGGLHTSLPFTPNALIVIANRYLQHDPQGAVIETPEKMFRRTAQALAQVEAEYGKKNDWIKERADEFYGIMASFKFTPAGRTLTNAGAPTPLVPNCIVLHIQDSMDGIFTTLREAALLQQAGSGLGFPFHMLRPAGTRAKRSRGMASGPISFLQAYDMAFGVIKQQGRHGANMAVMRVDHPDVLDFIHAKKREGDVKNFNISVGITDEFMRQALKGAKKPWLCEFNGVKMKPRVVERDAYNNILSVTEVTTTARELLYEISSMAWTNGEPGVVFLDEVNRTNPLPGLGRIEACNPCGEQFLHDGDACNLGSINLARFVKRGKVDYVELRRVTKIATRMLDNVVDLTDMPVDRVNRSFKSNRRIGLGIMGFADMLYQLRVPYNSKAGVEVAEKVMKTINDAAHEMSRELAQEKGVFPNHNASIYKKKRIPMRNAALTNVAPTGSISMMFDVSSGVEPYFALAYHKKGIINGRYSLQYFNKYLEVELKERGLFRPEIVNHIVEKGTLQDLDEIPADVKRVYVTSMDISAEDHIRMQGAFQKYTDNSISKTVNFPNTATKENILQGYILAWQLHCKGCTVYRDKSREFQILNLNEDKKQTAKAGEPAVMVRAETVLEEKKCPNCGEELQMKEGCKSCPSCGWGMCEA
ncbi:MAG: adenosylcobalamin-dependent ribonucleoside-diphosphate reductase [bacterium]|nr:adenosylcobalamin-dependent ribonucleoside-diphosphate reductase [bacterium]